MIIKHISRFILLIAVICTIGYIIYFVAKGFGIIGVVTLCIFVGFIVVYIQNKELKRIIKELDKKVDDLKN